MNQKSHDIFMTAINEVNRNVLYEAEEKGMEKGERKKAEQIAKKLKNHLAIPKISEATGINIEEIEYLLTTKNKLIHGDKMPVITIAGNNTITLEEKREMVKKVSEVVSEAYDLPIEAITVLVQSYPKDDIGVAGELLSDEE